MILNSGNSNTDQIIEKILLLNESFDKLSKIYKEDLETPNLEDNKAPEKDYLYRGDPEFIPLDDEGYPIDKDGNRIPGEKPVIGVRPDTSKKK